MNWFKKSYSFLEAIPQAEKTSVLNVEFIEFDLADYKKDILKFTKIEELYIHVSIDYPYSLPLEIGQLSTLKKLYVLNFGFKKFPEWVLNLTNLEQLMIRGNDIRELPREINNLSKLKILRLENCSISELPETLSKIEGLKKLSLSDNRYLKAIDSNDLPKNLKVLNLARTNVSENNVNALRSSMPKLKFNKYVE